MANKQRKEIICTELVQYGPAKISCSFCGRNKQQGALIVAGPGVNICRDCVDLIAVIMEEETQNGRT